jgi:hypothetical protein
MAMVDSKEMLPSGGAGLDARRSSLRFSIAVRRIMWLNRTPRRKEKRGDGERGKERRDMVDELLRCFVI